jgi:hypothetical protein
MLTIFIAVASAIATVVGVVCAGMFLAYSVTVSNGILGFLRKSYANVSALSYSMCAFRRTHTFDIPLSLGANISNYFTLHDMLFRLGILALLALHPHRRNLCMKWSVQGPTPALSLASL